MPNRRVRRTAELDSAARDLCESFLEWQCRLRQIAARRDGGRPSAGMRPRLLAVDGREIAAAATVLIVPREPEESTGFLRHQVRRTRDPRLVYESGLAYLQATHFQEPAGFAEVLTALFPAGSPVARSLLADGRCLMRFAQYGQSYALPATVARLAPESAFWQHTYWHNSIFNPGIPRDAQVLAFAPDWAEAAAEPPQNLR